MAGSGNLTVIGGTTVGTPGLVSLGNASNYTGTITVGLNGAIGFGNSTAGNFFGPNVNPISVSTVSSAVGLLADGSNTNAISSSTPETIAFTMPSNLINFVAANTGGYLIGKQGTTTLFNQEANKTLSLSANLPNNNTAILNVTPLNGYGLLLTGQTPLTVSQTYSVGGTQASNVIPGLTLQNLAASAGITISKTGTGTLRLQDTTGAGTVNGFGGTATLVDVTGGLLAFASDNDLGNAANLVKIDNATAGAAGILAEGNITTPRTFQITLANGIIGVSGGNTLTLNSGLAYAVLTNSFNKTENGTLVLTTPATTTTPTSGTTISAGSLKILASTDVGSGTITVANAVGGAATRHHHPAQRNAHADDLHSGPEPQQHRYSGPRCVGKRDRSEHLVNRHDHHRHRRGHRQHRHDQHVYDLQPDRHHGRARHGRRGQHHPQRRHQRRWRPDGARHRPRPGPAVDRRDTATGGLTVAYGTVTLSGTAGAYGASTAIAVNYGGTLTVDDTVNNIVRLGAAVNTLTTFGGTLNLNGLASATSAETLKSIAFQRGEDFINATPGAGGQANLTLTSGTAITRVGNQGSVIFAAPSLGSAAGARRRNDHDRNRRRDVRRSLPGRRRSQSGRPSLGGRVQHVPRGQRDHFGDVEQHDGPDPSHDRQRNDRQLRQYHELCR